MKRMYRTTHVRVPATTANLGPGFDCLGLALDLWNKTHFSVELNEESERPSPAGAEDVVKTRVRVEVFGEGAGDLPLDESNLLVSAALRLFERAGAPPPRGLRVSCENHIPLGSGLGSSSAAALAGLLGANEILGAPLSQEQILDLAAEIEGHPDNAAPALLGGLTLTALEQVDHNTAPRVIVRRIEIPAFYLALATPEFELSTRSARLALPASVTLDDAVFNTGRAALVVEALRSGDLQLLGKVMQDRLHQPYRLKLIPGAQAALEAAWLTGAPAALSGAGPSLVAFAQTQESARIAADAMQEAFAAAGLGVRSQVLRSSPRGAVVGD